MTQLCRDCAANAPLEGSGRCPSCGSLRLVEHPELETLAIAHIDCDAFYATIEKRDDPSIRGRPVIVGGGRRGVVSAACYIARLNGVHSAMPMFKALAACPDAAVIRPDMKKYAAVGRQVRDLMIEVTPMVEPISIDEAFLDLGGTQRLHGASPAQTLIRLIARIEADIGVTASVGLSYNKFLAKVASDLDKPRGFAVIGQAEARAFLATQPVGIIWGVGKALRARLAKDGITTVGQLQTMDEEDLVARYGSIGRRLARFSRGRDDRRVTPGGEAKSISAETTFDRDIAHVRPLQQRLWPLCEKVSARLKKAELAGRTLTLKLKSDRFRQITRSRQLSAPSQLAEVIYRTALPLLEAECNGTAYRLIGVGLSDLRPAWEADPADLLDPDAAKRAQVERTIDTVRAKLGDDAIAKGRGLRPRRTKSH